MDHPKFIYCIKPKGRVLVCTVNALKFLTLIGNKKCQANRADPDQTASSEAV